MKNLFWIIGFFLPAAVLCPAQSTAPGLADLVRQQKQEKKAVIVISDEDVAPVVAQVSSTSASGTSDAGASAKPADPAATAPATTSDDATANRKPSVSEMKKKLDSLKTEQESWKNAAKRNQDLLANETDDFRRQMYQEAVDNDRKNVAFYGRKIDEAQAELAKAQQASDKSSNQTSAPNGTKEP
jgi:hypothetical protein